MDAPRPRIPCQAALGAIGVPAKRWSTRADLFDQLETGRVLLAEDLDTTVAEAALSAAMSPEHFVRVFQETYGCTPRSYAARARLETAKKLLVSGNLSVGDIAFQCGYGDNSAFSRAFRRAFGVTPGQYRKRSNSAQ